MTDEEVVCYLEPISLRYRMSTTATELMSEDVPKTFVLFVGEERPRCNPSSCLCRNASSLWAKATNSCVGRKRFQPWSGIVSADGCSAFYSSLQASSDLVWNRLPSLPATSLPIRNHRYGSNNTDTDSLSKSGTEYIIYWNTFRWLWGWDPLVKLLLRDGRSWF
jgi:hypothetical protein